MKNRQDRQSAGGGGGGKLWWWIAHGALVAFLLSWLVSLLVGRLPACLVTCRQGRLDAALRQSRVGLGAAVGSRGGWFA
ncbi:uncharacterized protein IWZ02DRAFT_186146 [Phyllosticta citriasiana]|uniref:uncharacterized protein n=1 Tax=Phyllosticta citriasiana TaxID=595635 RepID=UPI0030FDB126